MNYELRGMDQNKGKITSFKDLIAWQYAHALVLGIYKLTKLFPKEEQFGLINQVRRAAVSITSNIAEGFSRSSYKEKAQFYSMSLGSLTEVQSQLMIAKDLGYVTNEDFISIETQTITVSKLLNGLIKKSRTMTHNS